MELENLVTKIFNDRQWEIGFSPEVFVLSAPSKCEVLRLASLEPETLAKWAQKFGKAATLIKYPGGKAYRIPATVASSEVSMGQQTLILDPQNPLIEVYALSLSPHLYQEIGWFLNNPTQPGGIVRIADNQQVAMSYANAQKSADFTPELGLNSENGWIEFANRYKLLVDEFGNSYHVSWNLGLKDTALFKRVRYTIFVESRAARGSQQKLGFHLSARRCIAKPVEV